MSLRHFRTWYFLLFAAVFLLCPSRDTAQQKVFSLDEAVRYQRDFLRDFHPELSGKRYWRTIEIASRYDSGVPSRIQLRVDIGERPKYEIMRCCLGGVMLPGPVPNLPPDEFLGPFPPNPNPPLVAREMEEDSDGATYPRQYLSVFFHFTHQGDLFAYFELDQRFHQPPSHVDFDLELMKHPEMPVEAIRALYRQSGAKFPLGDKESFKNGLPLKNLEQYLGKVTLLSAEFHYMQGTSLAEAGGFDSCSVVLKATSRSGKPLLYDAIFDGRLGTLLSLELRDETKKSAPKP